MINKVRSGEISKKISNARIGVDFFLLNGINFKPHLRTPNDESTSSSSRQDESLPFKVPTSFKRESIGWSSLLGLGIDWLDFILVKIKSIPLCLTPSGNEFRICDTKLAI